MPNFRPCGVRRIIPPKKNPSSTGRSSRRRQYCRIMPPWGINSNVYYRQGNFWKPARSLSCYTAQEATPDEVKQLHTESALKKTLAELLMENHLLKKSVIGGWGRRYMRYSASEKYEIIRLVALSSLSVRQALRRLDIHRPTFYNWLHRLQGNGIG